uniref:SSCRP protein n=1 Tax=Psilocybe cubensis TaxID=181762 RepID=A0A8H7XTG5_PSICU
MTNIKTAVLASLALAQGAFAICAGFNFAIGNQIRVTDTINRWNVYNDDCAIVDGLTTTFNPCTQGIFGCSPPPIIFNEYTSTFTGLRYACRPDPSSGQCGSDVISVCCRNDGN